MLKTIAAAAIVAIISPTAGFCGLGRAFPSALAVSSQRSVCSALAVMTAWHSGRPRPGPSVPADPSEAPAPAHPPSLLLGSRSDLVLSPPWPSPPSGPRLSFYGHETPALPFCFCQSLPHPSKPNPDILFSVNPPSAFHSGAEQQPPPPAHFPRRHRLLCPPLGWQFLSVNIHLLVPGTFSSLYTYQLTESS